MCLRRSRLRRQRSQQKPSRCTAASVAVYVLTRPEGARSRALQAPLPATSSCRSACEFAALPAAAHSSPVHHCDFGPNGPLLLPHRRHGRQYLLPLARCTEEAGAELAVGGGSRNQAAARMPASQSTNSRDFEERGARRCKRPSRNLKLPVACESRGCSARLALAKTLGPAGPSLPLRVSDFPSSLTWLTERIGSQRGSCTHCGDVECGNHNHGYCKRGDSGLMLG